MIKRLLQNCYRRIMDLPEYPVVVVLGATGVGKSDLAIEIAKKYDGEVISADAMQVYKDLDIVTNKVTTKEMDGIPHHMLNFLDPLESFTIVDFRNRSLPIIEKLLKQKKMPIIVGGTNYYIESLLFDSLVEPDRNAVTELVATRNLSVFPEKASEDLYAELKSIDPKRAEKLHPNDRRKISRSLDVFHRSKRSHSEFLEDQKKNGGVLGGPLRFKNSIVFWIQCQQDILEERLDKRVDKMISQGLIEEMSNFHENYNSTRKSQDYTLGIFQSIGFKEFHDYLIAPPSDKETKTGKRKFDIALRLMKQRTKKYSKYQRKWIMRRFIEEPDRETPPIYSLDGTDLEKWHANVKETALQIMDDIFNKRPTSVPPMSKERVVKTKTGHFPCECGTICMDENAFAGHKTSKKHYKLMALLRKNAEIESDQGGCSKRIKVSEDELGSGPEKSSTEETEKDTHEEVVKEERAIENK